MAFPSPFVGEDDAVENISPPAAECTESSSNESKDSKGEILEGNRSLEEYARRIHLTSPCAFHEINICTFTIHIELSRACFIAILVVMITQLFFSVFFFLL